MKSFSFQNRTKNIEELNSQQFDLLIIGGGITGAGVARDAAMRGMSVALVEADDFASGTSSRSSKLVHGGIRYLENMEFKLVFEALSERQKLFEMAPHLVHPLRFMIPLYSQGRVGMTKMGLGMWLYDALSLFQAPELHERLNPQETILRLEQLQEKDLLGSYVYSDAYMDDDRLVHETLRSANEYGACIANYVRATGVDLDEENQVQSVHCVDLKTQKKITVRARHFVSSVGPWTDQLGEDLFTKWKRILRPTKGIHLTFEKRRLPLSSAVVMAAEKRIVFGIPRHEMVIVGTTDTDFEGDPKSVSATPEDVTYLLGVIEKYFPGAKIKPEDIVASYAGVRPLVQDGSESEGKTSREHVIFNDDHGVTFVAGGKYTTYRLMAQQIVEKCLQSFSIEDRVKFNRSETHLPLNPSVTVETFPEQEKLRSTFGTWGLTQQEMGWLVDRHGLEASEILQKNQGLGYWELEASHAIQNTMCLHLVDFFSRRVPLILAYPDHGISLIDSIGSIFASRLGWGPDQTQLEKQKVRDHVAAEFAWRQKVV